MVDISWEQVWGVVITTIVAALIKILVSVIKEQRQRHLEEEERKNEILNSLMINNQELSKWKEEIDNHRSLVEEKLVHLGAQIQRITENDLILMKDKILHVCGFFISQGAITLAARENITDMYKCYQNMGGNGTCKLVYEQVMNLRIKDILLDNRELLDEDVKKEMTKNVSKPKRRKKVHSEEVGEQTS